MNFALDRQALQAIGGGPLGGRLTDQYLPSLVPGFRDGDVYPLDRPDLERARELARGNLRGARAVFYTTDFQLPLAVAQLAKQQLAAIGLEVEIKTVPVHIASAAYLERSPARGGVGHRARDLDAQPAGSAGVSQPAARHSFGRHERRRFYVACLRPAVAASGESAAGPRAAARVRLARHSASPATRLRWPRSACSTRRRSSRPGSIRGASSCARARSHGRLSEVTRATTAAPSARPTRRRP